MSNAKAMRLKAKIRNIAKSKNIPAQVILQNYMFERFLNRLSASQYKEKFVLKGGMLVAALVGLDNRATMDLDTTLKNLPLTPEAIEKALKEIFEIDLNDDVNFSLIRGVTKYRKSSGYNNLLSVNSGTSTQILGKDMRIYKVPSLVNSVEIDEKKVNLFLKEPIDDTKTQRIFSKWWRNTAARIFENEMNAMYDRIYKKYSVPRPKIVIRKMKTLWGSCSPLKSKITLNEYLLKADIRCIQYVILHELTHLLYPNHNKDFYDFLTIQMPDWKERKKQLDQEVVQWL